MFWSLAWIALAEYYPREARNHRDPEALRAIFSLQEANKRRHVTVAFELKSMSLSAQFPSSLRQSKSSHVLPGNRVVTLHS